jgi:phosphoribosyl-AMP cyclohydrolase / phosphoribosyl-ATP pyrophosphohydrolase
MNGIRADAVDALDWAKSPDGLLPAIVQHSTTERVLMLGYMNAEALRATLESGRVTFYSRSKGRLWTKGESSGHGLRLTGVSTDCDGDALLVRAEPSGPTCHLGTSSCFGDAPGSDAEGLVFLASLERVIEERVAAQAEGSYTVRLWNGGPARIAQKVGEEAVELALASVTEDDDGVVAEAADLLYHLVLLLKRRNLSLADAVAELARRRGAGDIRRSPT